MKAKKPIEIEHFGKAAVIKFVCPEIKNPLSVNTLEILSVEFEKLVDDDSVTTIIFTGSGDTFAAGANLNEVAALNEKTAEEFGLRGQRLMQKIYKCEKLTIAAIKGFCMGGALDLATSCDLRIASANSFFAHPGAKLGIITGWGGTQMLPRLIGRKRALDMFITAKKVRADEALEMGLISEIASNPLAKSLEKTQQ